MVIYPGLPAETRCDTSRFQQGEPERVHPNQRQKLLNPRSRRLRWYRYDDRLPFFSEMVGCCKKDKHICYLDSSLHRWADCPVFTAMRHSLIILLSVSYLFPYRRLFCCLVWSWYNWIILAAFKRHSASLFGNMSLSFHLNFLFLFVYLQLYFRCYWEKRREDFQFWSFSHPTSFLSSFRL